MEEKGFWACLLDKKKIQNFGKLDLHPVKGEKEQGAEEEDSAKEERRSGKRKRA